MDALRRLAWFLVPFMLMLVARLTEYAVLVLWQVSLLEPSWQLPNLRGGIL